MTVTAAGLHVDELRLRRAEFLARWNAACSDLFAADGPLGWQGAVPSLDANDLAVLFEAYLEDADAAGAADAAGKAAQDLLERLSQAGLTLAALEVLHAAFFDTAQRMMGALCPNSPGEPPACLERLTRTVVRNKVALARRYEERLRRVDDERERQAERLRRHNETMHEFLDVATHELQSPLWSILGFVAKIRRRCGESFNEEARHCLDRIGANVIDMHTLIGEMTALLTVSPEQLELGPVSLAEVLEDVAEEVRHEVDARFECHLETPGPWVVLADARQLRHLLVALAHNAARYVRPGEAGRWTVRVSVREAVGAHAAMACEAVGVQAVDSAQPSESGPARLHVYFEDNGIGIEPRYRELVFRPMERLLEIDVPGSGMGLTRARRIAEAHGGTLTIEDTASGSVGRGACLHLVLPIPATADPVEGIP
jgi:signal transduction histidine kinase